MRKQFCCDASRDLYEKYYLTQTGDGVPVYIGSRGQRGHGLGSMLSGLFRSAMPLIRRGLATFGRHTLKTGLEIANDVADGQSVKDSAKRRVGQGIKRFASQAFGNNQSGSGTRSKSARLLFTRKRKNFNSKVVQKKKKSKRKSKKGKKSKKKRKTTSKKYADIFN